MNIKHQNFKKSVHMEKCPFLLMETLLFMALFPSCFILERNTLILIGSEILLRRKLRWALLLFTYLRNVTIVFDPKYCRNVFRLVHVLAGNVGSSYQSCSMKQVVLKDLAKFTEKHVSQRSFYNKVTNLRWFLRIWRNFYEHLFYRTPLSGSPILRFI